MHEIFDYFNGQIINRHTKYLANLSMKRLLQLKHWQLFLVIFSTYFIALIFWQSDFNIAGITGLHISVLMSVIYIVAFFLWVLGVGLFLNSIPDNPHRFRGWLYTITSFLAMLAYIGLNLERLSAEGFSLPLEVMMFMPVLGLLGLPYTFYNVSKSLKSLETGSKVAFPAFLLEAVLFFAFPIGIWFIQPRLNRIYMVAQQK